MGASSGDHGGLAALVPAEIWDEVAPFLTGWELFNLATVSRDAHALFAAANWWRARLPRSPSSSDATAGANAQLADERRRYLANHSLAFVLDNGDDATVAAGGGGRPTRGAPIALTAAFSMPFVFGRDARAFSVEIWFALRGAAHGGILLGAGTPFHVSPSWNPMFETWIRVDEARDLHCSMLSSSGAAGTAGIAARAPVATKLERDRWHHLVVTFETSPAVPGATVGRDDWRIGEERVYVNGELATTQRGSLSRFWVFNSFVLLGTGCNSEAAAQAGEGKQWFPFNGVVDDMRVWHSVLLPHEVARLASHRIDDVPKPVHSWKVLATGAAPRRLQDHSIEFRGSHDTRPHGRGVGVAVASRLNFQRALMEDRLEFHPFCPDKSSSFAIEVWFYLLPEDSSNWGGGILIGAQSRDMGDAYSPSRTRQIIYVNRHGRLYASVLDEIMQPCTPRRLLPRRWYHVVLRYRDGKQEVFLNGVPRRCTHGALLRDWGTLSHMQVGTGCVNTTRGAPKAWYGFHGRIGEVRIWGPRLKDKQFTTILESSTRTSVGAVRHMQPVFSLQKDGRLPHFLCVQNSRPQEGVFVPRIDKPLAQATRRRQHHHNHQQDNQSEPEPEANECSLTHRDMPKHVEPTRPRAGSSSKWLRSVWHKATTALTSH